MNTTDAVFTTRNNNGWAVYVNGERMTANCFTTREAAHEFIHAHKKSGGKLSSDKFFERRASMPQDDWGW